MPINNKLLEGVNMGDAKNIKTGSSLTGGKGYLEGAATAGKTLKTVDKSDTGYITGAEGKKVAPILNTGMARKTADIVATKKSALDDLLKATK